MVDFISDLPLLSFSCIHDVVPFFEFALIVRVIRPSQLCPYWRSSSKSHLARRSPGAMSYPGHSTLGEKPSLHEALMEPCAVTASTVKGADYPRALMLS